jgi:predicted dehydrogenase
MKKIRIGIIGMGRMGITHYSIINSHPDVEVVAVADTSSFVLAMIKKYLKTEIYKDYGDLFLNTGLDAVLVCTPPNLHCDIVKQAGERGMHVFVEKPFTTRLADARELESLYAEKALVNQVGYVNRFNDVFIKAEQMVKQGIIGKLIRFKTEMLSASIVRKSAESGWRASRETGGGAVFEMASHAVDLINYIAGKPDRVFGSVLNYIYSDHVEDAAFSTFLYKNGMSGTLNINWSDTSYRKPTNKLELFGEGGRILADQHSLKVFLNREDTNNNLRRGWNTFYITDIFKPVPFYVRGNEFTRQLYHFIDCIQDNGIKNQCSFTDGANAMEIIEKIYDDYNENGKFS